MFTKSGTLFDCQRKLFDVMSSYRKTECSDSDLAYIG